jgi:hypothetical protein
LTRVSRGGGDVRPAGPSSGSSPRYAAK